jgi:hypothetical protein
MTRPSAGRPARRPPLRAQAPSVASVSGADEPVFVIDLRGSTMREVRREVAAARAGAFVPRLLPAPPDEPVRLVALLVDGRAEPVLLPITPTRDIALLDALARLVRFAVLEGLRPAEVARRYGGPLERSLADDGRLPAWAAGDLDAALLGALPKEVQRALGPGRAEDDR